MTTQPSVAVQMAVGTAGLGCRSWGRSGALAGLRLEDVLRLGEAAAPALARLHVQQCNVPPRRRRQLGNKIQKLIMARLCKSFDCNNRTQFRVLHKGQQLRYLLDLLCTWLSPAQGEAHDARHMLLSFFGRAASNFGWLGLESTERTAPVAYWAAWTIMGWCPSRFACLPASAGTTMSGSRALPATSCKGSWRRKLG